MTYQDLIICSFYTPDEYYSSHARALKNQLDELGIEHDLLEITKAPGEDWADTTRRKIGFIKEVCDKNPDKKVFWVDIDCRVNYLPEYIASSTADLIGFQRSFGSPLQIGYSNRTRFWEPSFWGLGTSPQARKLISDALELEQRAEVKATDDYFLEEAWRANAKHLTFQMIPSTDIVRERAPLEPGQRRPFFVFGSSGNVAEFKNKVVQHGGGKQVGLKRKALQQAKKLERNLPDSIRRPLRRLADTSGVTGVLTSGQARSIDPERAKAMGEILGGAIKGDLELYNAARARFNKKYIASHGESSNLEAAETFAHYSTRKSDKELKLTWWAKPFPGNFGDWLSPLIISHYSKAKVLIQSPIKPTGKKHLISLGSIGRFIQSSAVVVGTGISTDDVQLSRKAKYVSVRGPITAQALEKSKGPKVAAFGDPGIVISKIFPVKREKTNGKGVLVRHFSHGSANLKLPRRVDELSVMMSRPQDIRNFVQKLNKYDYVITSAMHVMITCQSYGIPCALVTFEGFEENVHGSGIKYEDYALGAGVEVLNPLVLPTDLSKTNLRKLARTIKVSSRKIKEVEAHIRQAIAMVLK